jgi:mannose-1-phosphate guanylyltransferase
MPILNQPILFYWLERLSEVGVTRVVINAHHLRDQMAEALKDLPRPLQKINTVLSIEPEILGTGGGLKNAASLLFPEITSPNQARADRSESFYVVNCDIYTDLDLKVLAHAHLSQTGGSGQISPPATLALVDRPEKATVSLDREGKIIDFRAPRPCPGEFKRLCGAGIMILERWFLDKLPSGFSDVVEHLKLLLVKGQPPLGCFFPEARWTDMGSPTEFMALNRTLAVGRQILRQPKLIEGQLKGFVLAEAGVRVEPQAQIEDTVLLSGAVVEKGAKVKDSVIAGRVPAGALVVGTVVI